MTLPIKRHLALACQHWTYLAFFVNFFVIKLKKDIKQRLANKQTSTYVTFLIEDTRTFVTFLIEEHTYVSILIGDTRS